MRARQNFSASVSHERIESLVSVSDTPFSFLTLIDRVSSSFSFLPPRASLEDEKDLQTQKDQ